MTRRDASWMISKAALVAGAPEFFSAWLRASADAARAHQHGSNAPPDPHDWSTYKPAFFSPEELRALDVFTAILIPDDETPGARQAFVAEFLDFVVNAAAEFAPDQQRRWRGAMEYLRSEHFLDLSPEAQIALVTAMSGPETDRAKQHPGFSTYKLIKDATVRTYYTSRAGLIDELNYQGLAYLTEFPGCTHPEHHRA